LLYQITRIHPRLYFLDILHSPKESFRTIDLIELTISSSVSHNPDLSLLRLPTVFHSSSSETSTNSMKLSDDVSTYTSSDNRMLTVARYISNINENSLIDYMFNCELRYSKNVLQIMKYLLPKLCQPFLIYELDFELMLFFRYIRWKMLNFYLKHTFRVRRLVERMFGLLDLGVSQRKTGFINEFIFFKITDYPGVYTTTELMWTGVLAGISQHMKELIGFSQDVNKTFNFNIKKKSFFSFIFRLLALMK
jgi:hypothetical protein